MALNRNKVIAAAQRYAEKHQYDRAIVEYERVLEEEPDDVRLHLKVGDLHLKMGAQRRAIMSYDCVATHYRKKGFLPKAVAIYKRILSIDPGLVEAHRSLGDTYVLLRLKPDAISQYQMVLGAYERDGRHQDTQELLAKIVQLAPEDSSNRIRLAEAHARQGEMDKAVEHFGVVLDELYSLQRYEHFIQVAERRLYLGDTDHDLLRRLCEIYLERGQARRALGRLQVLFRDDPGNLKTLGLLARAFAEIGKSSKAISVYREIARMTREVGDLAGELAACEHLLVLDPNDAAAKALVSGAQREVQVSVGPAAASFETEMTTEQQVARLVADVDLFVKYELHEHALEQLERLFELEPEHTAGWWKRHEICVELERTEEAVGALVHLLSGVEGTDSKQEEMWCQGLLALEPGHPLATARLAKLGLEGLVERVVSLPPGALAPPVLVMATPLPEVGGFSIEPSVLGPMPDDDAFGDLLDEAEVGGIHFDGAAQGDDLFGDLLTDDLGLDVEGPAPVEDVFGDLLMAEEVVDEDSGAAFGGLLSGGSVDGDLMDLGESPDGGDDFGGLLSVDAEAEEDDFGGLLVESGDQVSVEDNFGDLLSVDGQEVVEEEDFGAQLSVGGQGAEDMDDFGDLLSMDGADVADEDDFGDLLSMDGADVADEDDFGDLLGRGEIVADGGDLSGLMSEEDPAVQGEDDGGFGDLLGGDVMPSVDADDFGDLFGGAGALEVGEDDFGGLLEGGDAPVFEVDDFSDLLEGGDAPVLEVDDFGDLLSVDVLQSDEEVEAGGLLGPEVGETGTEGDFGDLMSLEASFEEVLSRPELSDEAGARSAERFGGGIGPEALETKLSQTSDVEEPATGESVFDGVFEHGADISAAEHEEVLMSEAPALMEVEFGEILSEDVSSESGIEDIGALWVNEPEVSGAETDELGVEGFGAPMLGVGEKDTRGIDRGAFDFSASFVESERGGEEGDASGVDEVEASLLLPDEAFGEEFAEEVIDYNFDLELGLSSQSGEGLDTLLPVPAIQEMEIPEVINLDDLEELESIELLEDEDIILVEDEPDEFIERLVEATGDVEVGGRWDDRFGADLSESVQSGEGVEGVEEAVGGLSVEDLEELDFFIASEMQEEANELLAELREVVGDVPELLARKVSIEGMDENATTVNRVFGQLSPTSEVDLTTVKGSKISELADNDASTRFDLGIAFKEMGQYRRAIEQFEMASRSVERHAEALRLIALCYRDSGDSEAAIKHLKKTLIAPRLRPSEQAGLRYDLALVYEACGDVTKVISQLREIQRLGGVHSTEVSAWLKRLGA